MSNVPTNLIPTRITGLPEYLGSSTLGYMPYIIDGRTYKVQFANIAAVGAVPSTREINTGSGLGGGGDLSANRTIYILPGGVDDSRLSATGVTAGTYGAADSVPVLTVNAQGRVTDVTLAPIVLSNYVPTSRTITAGAGLTGGGDLSANRSFAVNFSSTTPEPLGPGSPGVSTVAARGDHVHPAVDLSDTTETQGVLPLSRGGTGNSLSPVAGAIVSSSHDKLYLTTAGSVGQVLRSGGPGGVPFWTDVGAGTVTSVAVATANGFAGTVASPTLSPVITLSTTVTGMVKGNGTAVSAATAGVDYVEPGAYTASGLTMATARLLGRTTASVGAAQEISVGTGLTLSTGSLVNAAPDQVVSLTGAGTTTVTGTYPSFTITSNDSTAGTVTSVNASGGTTGMSFTGGPVTSAGTLTLNGTLAVSNGGTGATDAVAALTNLGAYPASNPAGYTSNVGTVTSVSGTGTVSGLSLSGTVTSAGSLTLGGTLVVTPSDFASQTANTVLAAPNGSAGVPTFRAIVAADIPTLNQNTTGTAGNVSGIVAVANGGTGASVAATARSNLGAAASGANTDITSIALTTGTISTSPVSGTDIVNKAYADSIASGINFHQSVRLATAAALPAYTYNNGTSGVGATITANANAALSVDGVAVVVGNRILVKNESGAAEAYNGVYTVTQTGSGAAPYILTRATDFDSSGSGVDQIDAGDFFLVTAGSTQANTSWVQQTPLPITVGTTAIVFTQFAAPVLYSAGTGLTLTGTTFSITNTGVSASTYGSASSVPVIAVNAQGQLTSASSSSIAIAASQITSGALAIANGGTGATDASGALSNLGAYPASNPAGYTSNVGTVTSVNLTAGTGVSVSGGPITASGSITVTNTAPDQVVSLTGAGATTVTGTYPNFTISSPTAGAGTVTSIDVSGGTTGLTTSGGPVTSSGTITLAGTLNVANGGTGATTLSSGYVLKGNGTSAVSASVIYDNGTNVVIGGTTANSKLDVNGDLTLRNGSGVIIGTIANSGGWYDFAGSTNVNGTQMSHSGTLRFLTASTERMRIDSSGRLFLGATTGVGNDQMLVAFNSSTAVTQAINMRDNNASGNGNSFLVLRRSDDTYLGAIGRSGTDSAMFVEGNSYLTLRTGGTERMRIAADGTMTLSIGGVSNTHQFNYNESGGEIQLIDSTGAGPILIDNVSGLARFYKVGTGAMSIGTTGANYLQFITNGSDRLNISSGGSVTASVDMRAPIFYDSNDTAYYIDAASTSVLSNVQFGTSPGSPGNGRIIRAPGSPYSIRQEFGSDNSGWRYGIAKNVSGTVAIQFYVQDDGQVGATGDFRAPIFYDSNNTAFYADMAGTSNFNQINLGDSTKFIRGGGSGQTILGVGSVNDAYLQVGGSYYSIWNSGNFTPGNYLPLTGGTLTGNLTLNSGSPTITFSSTTSGRSSAFGMTDAYNMYLNAPGGGVLFLSNFQAPIMYDRDNTGYYIDPASTSLTNIMAVGQGLAVFDLSTVASDPYGLVGITRRTDNNYSYLGFTRAGQHAMGMGIDTGNTFWIGGCSAGYNGVRTSSWLLMHTSGYVTAPVDMRSPIFYDSNNTAYYLDPASRSILSNISVITGATECGIRFRGDTLDFVGRYSDYMSLYNQISGGEFKIFNSGSAYLNVYGENGASWRAPIFYDSNDTGYYVDPNTTATSFRGRGEIFLGPNTSGQYLRVGGNGGATDHSTVSTSNGNLHIDAKAGNNLYLAWYNTSTVNVGGSLTANGNITAYSDIRIKDNIETIPSALDKLDKIRGVTYTRTDRDDKERRYAGVIAQEIEQVLPEAIFENEEYKSVDYNATIGLLIEAVKELTNKVKALEAKE